MHHDSLRCTWGRRPLLPTKSRVRKLSIRLQHATVIHACYSQYHSVLGADGRQTAWTKRLESVKHSRNNFVIVVVDEINTASNWHAGRPVLCSMFNRLTDMQGGRCMFNRLLTDMQGGRCMFKSWLTSHTSHNFSCHSLQLSLPVLWNDGL